MKTVQVRIAVAVDEDGDWHAIGSNGWDDSLSKAEAAHGWGSGQKALTWLTAELPIPAPQTVEAKVEEPNG